jgi:ABC-type amino acid transport substrate-binding protein
MFHRFLIACVAALFGFAAPAYSQGDLLSRIRESGTIRVANTQGHAPWDFLDDRNELVGLGVDLTREIAKRMNIANVEFVAARFPDLIPGIQAGRFDLAVAGHSITDERRKIVDFSLPYMAIGTSVFVREGDGRIRTLGDIAGKSIGTLAGSITEGYLAQEHGDKALDVRTYENATLALSDLAVGRVDAVIYSADAGAYIAKINDLAVVPAVSVNREVNAMAFRKGEDAFGAALNAAFQSMIDDGTYSALSAKWLGGVDMAAELRKAAN